MNLNAPPAAINEIERLERLNEDVLRYLTIRVEEHEEGPSAMMRRAERDRDRDDRRGDRGDRFGDRGDRFGDRGARPRDRDERPRGASDEAETPTATEEYPWQCHRKAEVAADAGRSFAAARAARSPAP